MPKPEKVTNPSAAQGERVSRPGKVGVDGGPGGVPGIPSVPTESNWYQEAFAALRDLYARDDGWLRIVPQDHGVRVYYKWKYTAGRWKNHYVMYCDEENRPAWALVQLESKVADVDAGARRPAMDTFHDPR